VGLRDNEVPVVRILEIGSHRDANQGFLGPLEAVPCAMDDANVIGSTSSNVNAMKNVGRQDVVLWIVDAECDARGGVGNSSWALWAKQASTHFDYVWANLVDNYSQDNLPKDIAGTSPCYRKQETSEAKMDDNHSVLHMSSVGIVVPYRSIGEKRGTLRALVKTGRKIVDEREAYLVVVHCGRGYDASRQRKKRMKNLGRRKRRVLYYG